MSIRLAPGVSERDLVLYLREAESARASRRDVLGVLTERFALSFDDARLAMDRAGGGVVRAASGNPANEPDPVKDPVAWTAYRLTLGLPVDGPPPPDSAVLSAAAGLLDGARREERTKGTEDVLVALDVVRQAVASTEPDRIRHRVLLEAATCVSVADEACISRLGSRPYAVAGSEEWAEAAALADAARRVTSCFAHQPDPALEDRGLQLVGRIVTGLMGQSPALVGKAMIDSARCAQRNGDSSWAADLARTVSDEFAPLVGRFETEDPFDEHALALEHLLAATQLLIDLRGTTPELEATRSQLVQILGRSNLD